MTLVQELREQLERVVRDPCEVMYGVAWSVDAVGAVDDATDSGSYDDESEPTQAWRIAVLTYAIRAAVAKGVL